MARAHGIDISYAQKTFDLGINRDDIQFVIIRVGNGTTKDNFFDEFVIKAAGAPVKGAYHYFRSEISPVQEVHGTGKRYPWKKQADLFLELVRDKGFDFYVLDYESNKIMGELDNVIDDKFDEDFRQWLRYVGENTGKPMLIYTNLKWYRHWMRAWPLWIAQWWVNPDRNKEPVLPQGVTQWRFWQYSAEIPPNQKGAEYGVSSLNIDLDVYNGTLDEMHQWLSTDHGLPLEEQEPLEEKGFEISGLIVTWEIVILAAQKVASEHGHVFFSWMQEAGLAGVVENPERWHLPYDGPPIVAWPFTTVEDPEQIKLEILRQIKEQVLGTVDAPKYTWRDLMLAANDVAVDHDQNFFTWFKEAGMEDRAEDASVWDKLYDGLPVDEWAVPAPIQMEINRQLEKSVGIDGLAD